MKCIDTQKLLIKAIGEERAKVYEILRRYALVVGTGGYILTDHEFVHQVRHSPTEKVTFDVHKQKEEQENGAYTWCPIPTAQLQVDLEEFEAVTDDSEPNLPTWGSQFGGRKERIEQNYRLFCNSCKEIGANEHLPIWELRR